MFNYRMPTACRTFGIRRSVAQILSSCNAFHAQIFVVALSFMQPLTCNALNFFRSDNLLENLDEPARQIQTLIENEPEDARAES